MGNLTQGSFNVSKTAQMQTVLGRLEHNRVEVDELVGVNVEVTSSLFYLIAYTYHGRDICRRRLSSSARAVELFSKQACISLESSGSEPIQKLVVDPVLIFTEIRPQYL
ncbi:unnamed protein product [Phytophthora lilii]|uniref:Unnamed protein product n=1 Tax=Phytophthora lilii TaxID=2077276 RepID=A0A9W6U0Z2_9STRA|nr:unnamed protein product [Phytophthora lilii]